MEKLTEPKVVEINLENIILKRLKYYPEYQEDFINSISKDISTLYDETTVEYSRRLIAIDSEGKDDAGYFTLGKDIWIIIDKETEKLIGYEVITRKRGGSIKLGPTYIKKEFRGKGYASECDLGLFDEYAKIGARKVYLTAPINDMSSAILDFKKLGFKMEAILFKHYSSNFSERICGKFLNEEELDKNSQLNISICKNGEKKIDSISLNDFRDIDMIRLKKVIIDDMSENFDNIDEEFVENLFKNSIHEDKVVFENKNKNFYCFWDEQRLVGLCVGTFKRGGVYKIIPFILNEEYMNDENLFLILNKIIEDAITNNRKKITFFIPIQKFSLINLFSNQCLSEGILKAPYKKGRDIAIFSRFI